MIPPASTRWTARPHATARRNAGWVYVDVVDRVAAGATALAYYAARYPHSSAATWGGRLRDGQLRRGDEVLTAASILCAGDRLEYRRPPWTEPPAPRAFAMIWDDGDLLAVVKPAGLQVLPAGLFLENTLVHAVRERVAGAPAPAHRLDRGTSGIVLFARTRRGRCGLAAALSAPGARKLYHALVQGAVATAPFAVEVPIGPVPYPGLGQAFAARSDGRSARSRVRLLERRPAAAASLVEVELATGRPHQIRIHLAAVGHPLVGDPFYERGGWPRPPSPARPVRPGDGGYHLHAVQVAFRHPATGAAIALYAHPPEPLRVG